MITDQSLPIITMNAQGDQLGGVEDIDFIEWVSKGAAGGDDLVIDDDDGMNVVEDSADGANYFMIYPIKRKINKLVLATLDSGKVKVHKKDKSY
jgi:hypothetical protein